MHDSSYTATMQYWLATCTFCLHYKEYWYLQWSLCTMDNMYTCIIIIHAVHHIVSFHNMQTHCSCSLRVGENRWPYPLVLELQYWQHVSLGAYLQELCTRRSRNVLVEAIHNYYLQKLSPSCQLEDTRLNTHSTLSRMCVEMGMRVCARLCVRIRES